jgi:hypothetical protein
MRESRRGDYQAQHQRRPSRAAGCATLAAACSAECCRVAIRQARARRTTKAGNSRRKTADRRQYISQPSQGDPHSPGSRGRRTPRSGKAPRKVVPRPRSPSRPRHDDRVPVVARPAAASALQRRHDCRAGQVPVIWLSLSSWSSDLTVYHDTGSVGADAGAAAAPISHGQSDYGWVFGSLSRWVHQRRCTLRHGNQP